MVFDEHKHLWRLEVAEQRQRAREDAYLRKLEDAAQLNETLSEKQARQELLELFGYKCWDLSENWNALSSLQRLELIRKALQDQQKGFYPGLTPPQLTAIRAAIQESGIDDPLALNQIADEINAAISYGDSNAVETVFSDPMFAWSVDRIDAANAGGYRAHRARDVAVSHPTIVALSKLAGITVPGAPGTIEQNQHSGKDPVMVHTSDVSTGETGGAPEPDSSMREHGEGQSGSIQAGAPQQSRRGGRRWMQIVLLLLSVALTGFGVAAVAYFPERGEALGLLGALAAVIGIVLTGWAWAVLRSDGNAPPPPEGATHG